MASEEPTAPKLECTRLNPPSTEIKLRGTEEPREEGARQVAPSLKLRRHLSKEFAQPSELVRTFVFGNPFQPVVEFGSISGVPSDQCHYACFDSEKNIFRTSRRKDER